MAAAGVEQLGSSATIRSSTSSSPTARTTFDDDRRAMWRLSRLHARIVEEAAFLWVAHDVGPRADERRRCKGVVQPQSWFIDIFAWTTWTDAG
jgi:hypothetical protein